MQYTHLKPLMFALLLFPVFTFAGEDKTNDLLKHTSVGSQQIIHAKEKNEGSSGFFNSASIPSFFSPGMHSLSSVDAFGYSIELEDGSEWKISSSDAHKVASWGAQDPIIITQNNRWFAKYSYRIINQTTGSVLEANLFVGPLKEGPYTKYIMSIDTARGELILSDQTRWLISSLDEYGFKDWALYDPVIIGSNSGWDSSCQGLLINVNMNQFIRGQPY